MFRVELGKSGRYCDGWTRRSFLQIGMAGMGSATLADVSRARAVARTAGHASKETSVILLWLDGGPSHLDLYDMKPEAPAECRGLWKPIRTNVPGIEITELFPLQAKMADKFSIVRSLHHDSGDHFTGGHYMLTGRGGASGADQVGKFPCFISMATKETGARRGGMPAHVAVPHAMSIGLRPGYFGGHFLGNQHDPFDTGSDPNADKFVVQGLQPPGDLTIDRLQDRSGLLQHLDAFRHNVDRSGVMNSFDHFQQSAYDLVTGPTARRAFDIDAENPELRDRYGRHDWGQSALLARRLVEAGCTFVTCHFGGWDHHWNLKTGMENYLPRLDTVVASLFEDLSDRGLLDQVLVMICGEFSRTPRMNDGGNGGPPMSQGTPGRDHWGRSLCCVMGGGGVQGGRIVGATDAKGEVPADRPLTPGDLHATVFDVLGVDRNLTAHDQFGRPVRAIEDGERIHELF